MTSTDDLLARFRDFVVRNAVVWERGSNHHHPIWQEVADALQSPTPDGVIKEMGEEGSFQERVDPWLIACFGEQIARDRQERAHRFLEEALELVQAACCTAHEAHQLVDYVYGRPAGEMAQEVGGVMTTLAAFCLAHGLDMHEAGETELARIWTKVEKIRAKQAAKPKHSPLPEAPASPPDTPSSQESGVGEIEGWVLVPREPTEEMYNAGYDATRLPGGMPQFADTGFCLGHSGNIYRAMIEAAPRPSQREG